jgi:hypothetical protein
MPSQRRTANSKHYGRRTRGKPRRKLDDPKGTLVAIEDEFRVPKLPEGRKDGLWDNLAYLLLSEKMSNEACEEWRTRVFEEVQALIRPNP